MQAPTFDYLSLINSAFKYKILIVDDQSFNIEALKIILQYCVGLDADVFCESALSGQQALHMVQDDLET